jgi:hypothetical protein
VGSWRARNRSRVPVSYCPRSYARNRSSRCHQTVVRMRDWVASVGTINARDDRHHPTGYIRLPRCLHMAMNMGSSDVLRPAAEIEQGDPILGANVLNIRYAQPCGWGSTHQDTPGNLRSGSPSCKAIKKYSAQLIWKLSIGLTQQKPTIRDEVVREERSTVVKTYGGSGLCAVD